MSNVLVIGGGGREHAIAWKLAQSKNVEHVFVAPGNGGTVSIDKVSNVSISEKEHDRIIAFCKENVFRLHFFLCRTFALWLLAPKFLWSMGLPISLQHLEFLGTNTCCLIT